MAPIASGGKPWYILAASPTTHSPKDADQPMDFADATLVHLAQRESLSTVFTIDHDDFETYRVGGRKRLRLLPSR